MTILELNESTGESRSTVLGQDVLAREKLQHVVPAGTWFGLYPNVRPEYSVVGCTVAPGFDFDDFDIASRADLHSKFPSAAANVERLTVGLP